MPRKPADSLLTELSNPPRPNARNTCLFIEKLDGLDADRAKGVRQAVDNPRWSARALSSVLTKHGVTVSAGAIQNHRNGTCPCFRHREENE